MNILEIKIMLFNFTIIHQLDHQNQKNYEKYLNRHIFFSIKKNNTIKLKIELKNQVGFTNKTSKKKNRKQNPMQLVKDK